MATSSVVVHDIDRLDEFCGLLADKRKEIEALYDALVNACTAQESNWQDPQYADLKDKLDAYANASKSQLQELDDAVGYISALVSRLRTI